MGLNENSVISSSPGKRFELVVAHASNVQGFRAFYVAVSGDIDVKDIDDNAELAVVVIAGTVLPVAFNLITALNNGAVLYGIK